MKQRVKNARILAMRRLQCIYSKTTSIGVSVVICVTLFIWYCLYHWGSFQDTFKDIRNKFSGQPYLGEPNLFASRNEPLRLSGRQNCAFCSLRRLRIVFQGREEEGGAMVERERERCFFDLALGLVPRVFFYLVGSSSNIAGFMVMCIFICRNPILELTEN